MDEEHAGYNILLTVQRHTFDDFYRKINLLASVSKERNAYSQKTTF